MCVLHRRSGPVRAVTCRTHRTKYIVPLLQALLFVSAQWTTASSATTAERWRRREQALADQRDAFRRIQRLRRLDEIPGVRQLEEIRRQHCLDDDVRVWILRERTVIAGEALVASLVERFAGANRLDAHPRILVLHRRAYESGIERPESLQRPQRVEAREKVV